MLDVTPAAQRFASSWSNSSPGVTADMGVDVGVGSGVGADVGVLDADSVGEAVVSSEVQAVAVVITSAPVVSARSKFLVFFMFSINPVKTGCARQVTNFRKL